MNNPGVSAAPAAEPKIVTFLSAGAAQGIFSELADAFRASTGQELQGSFGAVGAMLERFMAGEPCDLLILTRAQMEKLVASGQILSGSLRDLGKVRTGIGVPTASSLSPADINTPDALRASLQRATAVYFPDPIKATAGIHFAGVLDKLGLRETLGARCKTFPNGATAMRTMVADATSGAVLIGCTQATEILNTPDARLVGMLPVEFELATVYTIGISARCASPVAAHAFAEKLAGDAALARRAKAGFES